jgi:hypothetical protein
MATSPEVTVRVNLVPPVERTTVVNPARGAKPGSYFLAAVRRRQDRDYVPTDVWNEIP